MTAFKFDKPIVESLLAPETTDVYWVEKNNNTGKLKDIKEFIGGEWVTIFEQPAPAPTPDPEPEDDDDDDDDDVPGE